MLSDKEIAAIRERAERATKGPWRYDPRLPGFQVVAEGEPIARLPPNIAAERDAHFIAAAREYVPRLLAEVERLGAACDLIHRAKNIDNAPPGFPNVCNYCHGIGACPVCWGRAGITALESERDALKEKLARVEAELARRIAEEKKP